MKKMFLSLPIVVGLLFLLAVGKTEAANDAINLTLSPTFLQFENDPASTSTRDIRIRNNGSATENLKISVGKFRIDSTGEKPILYDPQPNDETMSWLTFDAMDLTIAPQEWGTVRVTFSPPQHAALSYYYIIYFSRAEQQTSTQGTNLVGSPALLVLTTVNSSNAKRELQLESFIAKKGFLEFLPQEFELKIKNTGNVNAVPNGNIFIDGQGTKDLAILSINPSSKVILPNSSRTFTVLWEDGFPLLKDNLKWNFENASKFRIGRYTANTILVYDNGLRDIPLESTLSFWVFPTRLAVIAMLILLAPALLTFLFMRMRRSRK